MVGRSQFYAYGPYGPPEHSAGCRAFVAYSTADVQPPQSISDNPHSSILFLTYVAVKFAGVDRREFCRGTQESELFRRFCNPIAHAGVFNTTVEFARSEAKSLKVELDGKALDRVQYAQRLAFHGIMMTALLALVSLPLLYDAVFDVALRSALRPVYGNFTYENIEG